MKTYRLIKNIISQLVAKSNQPQNSRFWILRHSRLLPKAFGTYFQLLTSFLLLPFLAGAQNLLTESEAIRIGLENNFDIRLVKQEKAIAESNNTLGNAGFLPTVSLSAGQTNSVTDASQEFITGQVNDRNGAKSDALSLGAQLNWTLFDGMQMFTRRDRLALLEQQSELQLLLTVETSVYNILATYYTLIQNLQQMDVVEKSIEIDHERLQLAGQMLDIGAGSRLELLQAEVDLNADSALILGLQDQVSQLRTSLNNLLGRAPETSFAVADSFEVNRQLLKEVLLDKMMQQNTSLRLSKQDINLAMLSLREIKGRQAPSLAFNLGYNYNDQSSESGFLISSTSKGVTYGFNAKMSVFEGFAISRQKQNARIAIETSQIQLESLENGLRAQLHSEYTSYLNSLQLLNMESKNVLAARENLSIANERYKLGDLAGIEFREAQRNFMTAEARLLNVMLKVKMSETSLLQLAGELVVE